MKNCGYRFHTLVTTRDFVEAVLVRSIIPRNSPPLVVHDRVLGIIQVSKMVTLRLSKNKFNSGNHKMNALKSDIYSAAVHSGMRSIAALS